LPGTSSYRSGPRNVRPQIVLSVVIALQRSYIHISFTGKFSLDYIACGNESIQQLTQILIIAMAGFPKQPELVKSLAGGGHGAPNPVGTGILFLDLDFLHKAKVVTNHSVKE